MQKVRKEEETTVSFKILVIGDSGVGKSSILVRFTDDEFEDGRACTIGVDFKTKLLDLSAEQHKINLNIWDTAGQEKFRSLTSSYYRGTHGIILVYDVTKRKSFESITHWLNEVNLYSTNSDVCMLLIGNKIDKPEREVSREEGSKFARQHNMLFVECSSKTRLGVDQGFDDLVQKILNVPSLWSKEKGNSTTVHPEATEQSYYQSYCGGYQCLI